MYLHWESSCLLYTSDAADDLLCVDLGGRRIIKTHPLYNPNYNNIAPSRRGQNIQI